MVRWSGLTALVLWLVAATTLAGEVVVEVPRAEPEAGESFELLIQAPGHPVGEPEITLPGPGLEVLGRHRTDEIRVHRGRIRRETTWRIELLADAPGSYRLPPIRVGQSTSEPVTIRVRSRQTVARGEGEEVFVDITATPESVRVGAQVVVRLRLFHAVSLRGAKLEAPVLDGVEAFRERLGDDRQYQTRRDGRRYAVVERRYAFFPQAAGTLHVRPVPFNGRVMEGGMRGPAIRRQSPPLAIEVKPALADEGEWLPARDVELLERWRDGRGREVDPAALDLQPGDSLTRELAVIGEGLTGAQLPTPEPAPGDPGLSRYRDGERVSDQVGPEGVTGIRRLRDHFLAVDPGAYELPAREIRWWDVDGSRWKTARLPARTIRVASAETTATADDDAAAGGLGWVPWLLAGLIGLVGAAVAGLRLARHPVWRLRQAFRGNRAAAAAREALLDWAAGCWPGSEPAGLEALAGRLEHELAGRVRELERSLYGARAAPWRGLPLWQAFRAARPCRKRARKRPGSGLPGLYDDRGEG